MSLLTMCRPCVAVPSTSHQCVPHFFLVEAITGVNIKEGKGNNIVGFQDSPQKFFNFSPKPWRCYHG